MPKKNKVPEGYELYTNMGRPIPGTRFIAFKVPLNDHLASIAEGAGEVLTPRLVMDHCSRLAMIIDLTFTKRYYDPQIFENQNIGYNKIFMEGRKIPSNVVVKKFFQVVDNFIKENRENDKLIGVHCTHGVNRTGYLICRYMIQSLKISADQAISAFNSARGHEQQHEFYLNDLRAAEWINDVYSDTENEHTDDSNYFSSPYRFSTYDRKRRSGSKSNTPDWHVSRKSRSRSPLESSKRSRSRSRSSHPARDYYDHYYGERSQQYDPYFYQKQGCSIGPHRPPHRKYYKESHQERDSRRPRQYKGPKQYRSPNPNNDEWDNHTATTPFKSFVETADAFSSPLPISPLCMDKKEKKKKYSQRTPTGPTRNPLSPGVSDDVFSPEYSRRSVRRYNPY